MITCATCGREYNDSVLRACPACKGTAPSGSPQDSMLKASGLNPAAAERLGSPHPTSATTDARLIALLEAQVTYTRKIHYWVRFMGWALLVSIVFGLIAAIAIANSSKPY